jgi:radical SAM protein with 4Fe4S-binding SPASM domain
MPDASITEIMKQLAQMWISVSPEEKQVRTNVVSTDRECDVCVCVCVCAGRCFSNLSL